MWRLSQGELLSFALGTVLMDLTSTCWFTYLLIYLEDTLNFDPINAGIVLLVGQVADAIATPLVGYWSDMSSSVTLFSGRWQWLFDRRTKWHFIGACIVVVFYSLIWTVNDSSGINSTWSTVYYAVGAALFNFGWAALQVPHLALTGDLSFDENCRTRLNSARLSMSVISSLIVFLTYLLFVEIIQPYGEKTQEKFRYLACVVLLIGLLCNTIFYINMHHINLKRNILMNHTEDVTASQFEINESTSEDRSESDRMMMGNSESGSLTEPLLQDSPKEKDIAHWKDWLLIPQFYVVGVIYMVSRAALNMTIVYMSFFLVKTLEMDDTSLALVPIAMYVTSFVTTLRLSKISQRHGREKTFNFGAVVVVASSIICSIVGTSTLSNDNFVYIASIFFGLGLAIMLVGSLDFIADLVGVNLQYGAFVYGIMSFADKLMSGILIISIQLHRDNVCVNENDEPDTKECQDFVRLVMVFAPSGAAVIAIYCVYLVQKYWKSIPDISEEQVLHEFT